MATGDGKKAKAKLDALAEELKTQGRKVKVVRLTKQEAADLVASFEVDADAYAIEEEASASTAVTLLMMPTKVDRD